MSDDYEVEVIGGETPSTEAETTSTETPTEVTPQVETPIEQPQTELYELPDGRKVDAQTVLQEYKNLQSDYTRKSQKLASYEKPAETINKVPDYKDPEWIPRTYSEIIEAAKQEIEREQQSKLEQQQLAEKELDEHIESQLAEVKRIDPKVDENKLFEHATKYGISNLLSAYNNLKEFNKVIEQTRERTAKEVQKRNSDPVATVPGQSQQVYDGDTYDPSVRTTSLRDYLRQIKK